MTLDRPIVFLDAESAGDANDVNPSRDLIIEFGAVKVRSFTEPPEKWRFVCNPGIPIVPERSAVHGHTDESVKDQPPFSFFAAAVVAFVADCDLAGFNLLNYDVPLLWEELYRCGITLDLKGVHIVDAGTIFKRKEERSLSAAVKFYSQDWRGLVAEYTRVTEPVFNTKRNKGVRVISDPGYAQWMLKNDFPTETRMRIREILDEFYKS